MNKELLIQVAKRTQRKVKQELPTKAFLTEKQINRRLSVGSYGRRLMEWMKEQQQERYQQLLQEGDLFLAKPNQLITYAADETDPWEYYWVGFNGACANKLVQQTPFSDTQPVHHCKDPQAVRESLYNIYLSRGPEPQCEALMTGYLYIFMAHLMQAAREAMPNVGSSSSQYVLAAIKYIQFNYSHDISVDDIAKAVGVSRSHLYRVFMSNVGQSPIDYLTSYRISEACSLLKNSSLSIAEIAVSVGFFDQFYFSRVFKKVKGVPPSKYLATLEKEGPAAPQAINP